MNIEPKFLDAIVSPIEIIRHELTSGNIVVLILVLLFVALCVAGAVVLIVRLTKKKPAVPVILPADKEAPAEDNAPAEEAPADENEEK